MSTPAKYHKVATISIYSLGVFLGAIHVLLGLIAFTPAISQDYHREVRINFNAFSKSLTFLHDFIDRASLAVLLRNIIASLQVAFGLILLENGHLKLNLLSKIASYGLVGVNVVFLLLQILSGSSYERIAPTIVFCLLLSTRILVTEQSLKRGKIGVKTRNAGKPKSSPKKNRND